MATMTISNTKGKCCVCKRSRIILAPVNFSASGDPLEKRVCRACFVEWQKATPMRGYCYFCKKSNKKVRSLAAGYKPICEPCNQTIEKLVAPLTRIAHGLELAVKRLKDRDLLFNRKNTGER